MQPIGLIVIVVIAFIVWFIIITYRDVTEEKRKRASYLRQEKEKEEKQKQFEEAEDPKYTSIINCPDCKGNGEIVWQKFCAFSGKGSDDYEGPYSQPDAWHLIEGGSKEYRDGNAFYSRVECPFCKGQGIAYAYFESKNVPCKRCNGSGTLEIKKRERIGVETATIICPLCTGSGSNIVEYVHYKRIYSFKNKEYNFPKLASIQLNDLNRNFFSVSKPRDATSEENEQFLPTTLDAPNDDVSGKVPCIECGNLILKTTYKKKVAIACHATITRRFTLTNDNNYSCEYSSTLYK